MPNLYLWGSFQQQLFKLSSVYVTIQSKPHLIIKKNIKNNLCIDHSFLKPHAVLHLDFKTGNIRFCSSYSFESHSFNGFVAAWADLSDMSHRKAFKLSNGLLTFASVQVSLSLNFFSVKACNFHVFVLYNNKSVVHNSSTGGVVLHGILKPEWFWENC